MKYSKVLEKFFKGVGLSVLVVAVPTLLNELIATAPDLFSALGIDNTIWLTLLTGALNGILNWWKHRNDTN